jgi:hypothetical protein
MPNFLPIRTCAHYTFCLDEPSCSETPVLKFLVRPPSMLMPPPVSFPVSSGGANFLHQYATDYPGNTLAQTCIYNVTQCLNACLMYVQCVGLVYSTTGNKCCYGKTLMATAVTSGTFDAYVLLRSELYASRLFGLEVCVRGGDSDGDLINYNIAVSSANQVLHLLRTRSQAGHLLSTFCT